MARPLRPQVENGIHHVFNRGNAKEPIFGDDADRAQFVAVFRRVKRLCDWSCLTYCLLINHYHLVVRTPRPNLARGMARLNSRYAQAFNRRHERVGHLFQGRYGSRLVQDDEHFLTALRYVALNPVESSLVADPAQWRWNGHRELLGQTAQDLVDVDETLQLIASGAGNPRQTYASMFSDGVAVEASPVSGEVIAGDRAFAQAAVAGATLSAEMPSRQRHADRPELLEIFAQDRDAALLDAYYEHGYGQREIADYLACHYSTVSRWLRLAEERSAMWQRKT